MFLKRSQEVMFCDYFQGLVWTWALALACIIVYPIGQREILWAQIWLVEKCFPCNLTLSYLLRIGYLKVEDEYFTCDDVVALSESVEGVLDQVYLHAGLEVTHTLAQDSRKHTPQLSLKTTTITITITIVTTNVTLASDWPRVKGYFRIIYVESHKICPWN